MNQSKGKARPKTSKTKPLTMRVDPTRRNVNPDRSKTERCGEKVYTVYHNINANPNVPASAGFGLSANQTNAIITLNPGNPVFLRASREAQIWNRWRITSDVVVKYVPIDSDYGCTGGRALLGFNPDVTDDPICDPNILQDLRNQNGLPSDEHTIRIPLDVIGRQWRYTRTGCLPTGTDPKMYDAGNVYATVWSSLPNGTGGTPSLANTAAGDIYVYWDLQYESPIAPGGTVSPPYGIGMQNVGTYSLDTNSVATTVGNNLDLVNGNGMTWTSLYSRSRHDALHSLTDECNFVGQGGVFRATPGYYLAILNLNYLATGGYSTYERVHATVTGTGIADAGFILYEKIDGTSTPYIPANPGHIVVCAPVIVPQTTDGSPCTVIFTLQIQTGTPATTFTLQGQMPDSITNLTMLRVA